MKNILFILSLLFVVNANAEKDAAFEEKKVIQKSFGANSNFELEINNKHGNITFETWKKDSVSIKVTIEVHSDKLERVNELIDRIDVHFSNYSQFISATTEWGSSSTGIKVNIMNLLSDQSISVGYKVMLPDGLELDITNKFGDVSFADYSGELKVDLTHGSIFGDKIKEGKLLKISYGKISIKEMNKADIVSKFSDINIDEIDNLRIDAISSEIEIEKVVDFELISILSEIEIEELEGKLDGEIKFGSLEIEEVSNTFRGIVIKGSNTDIDLSFDQQIAFHYFVQMEKGKAFRIPSEGNTLNRQNQYEETKEYEGVFTTSPLRGQPASVSVKVKNSYIRFGIE